MTYAFTHLRGEIETEDFICTYCAYVQIKCAETPEPVYTLYDVEHIFARIDVFDPDTQEVLGFYQLEHAPFAEQHYWTKAIHKALAADIEDIDPTDLNFSPAI